MVNTATLHSHAYIHVGTSSLLLPGAICYCLKTSYVYSVLLTSPCTYIPTVSKVWKSTDDSGKLEAFLIGASLMDSMNMMADRERT